MGERFRLDVEVGELRRVQRRLGAHAGELEARARKVQGLPDEWRHGWTGAPARTMRTQARRLAEDTRGFADHFTEASAAVKQFADAVEHAEDVDLPRLNQRWKDALSAHRAALDAASRRRDSSLRNLPEDTTPQARNQARRELDDIHSSAVGAASSALSATQQRITQDYEELVADLERDARRLARALARSVALPIKVGEAGPFTLAGLRAHPAAALPSDELYAELRDQAQRQFGGPAGELLSELEAPSNDLDEVTAMLERARALGLEPFQYAAALEQYWFLEAAARAGIDVSTWDPSKGAAYNEEIIMAVYRYYGDLYLENADLQWAGMANLIGPSFAGGFLDLSMIRELARALERNPFGRTLAEREALRAVAGMTDEDLEFYETTLLAMQRDIFLDQGTMHEAHRQGGIEAIAEMHAAGILDRTTYEAWVGLDSGVPSRVQAANEHFLYREQYTIIQDNYQKRYDHEPTGPVVTWGMTQIGAPSIPGAQSYADIDPLTVREPTPDVRDLGVPFTPWKVDNPLQGDVVVETPFAAGNVAHFDDRWRLIEEDTLPAYQRLLEEDPDLVRRLYRLTSRIDDIVVDLATDWEVVGFEQ